MHVVYETSRLQNVYKNHTDIYKKCGVPHIFWGGVFVRYLFFKLLAALKLLLDKKKNNMTLTQVKISTHVN